MKMNKRFIILSTITLLFIGALYLYKNHQNEEKAKAEFWKKQKPRIETFFRYNFNEIKTIDYVESEFNEHTTVSKQLGQLRKNRTSYKTVDEIKKEEQENNE